MNFDSYHFSKSKFSVTPSVIFSIAILLKNSLLLGKSVEKKTIMKSALETVFHIFQRNT